MTIQEQLDNLEALTLLGTSKQTAVELADQIALQLDPDERPDLALRLLIRRFLTFPQTPEALARLSTAEAWATSTGEHRLATEIQLRWCRHVGLTDPDAVPRPILDDAVRQAQDLGILDAEWRLALAVVQPENGLALREEALAFLGTPGQAHERLRVHLEVASDKLKGADTAGALASLEEGYNTALTHQDPTYIGLCATRLGLHYIDRGLADRAIPYLERALTIATSEDNDLQIIVTATLLSTLYLSAGNQVQVAQMADHLLISGGRRANWFAVVDGHITHSSLSLINGDTAAAVNRLVRAILQLQELVPSAAINILKGRLAELRHEIGTANFDDHYQRSFQANTNG